MRTPLKVPLVGAIPVLVTPFDDDGALDDEGLRQQIDFCIGAGSQALVFGWGSESHLLTDAEKEHLWRTAANHVNGRVPLVVATSHASREGMIALTHVAKDCGADCAMVNPEGRKGEHLVGLFRDLSDRVGLPLMIQDAQGNAPAGGLLQTVHEAPSVVSLKIECPGAPHKMGLIAEGLKAKGFSGDGDRTVTVLGGSNGGLLLEELARGSVGSLPHPVIIDAFGTVCQAYAQGDFAEAKDCYYEKILPLSRMTAAGGAPGGGIWLHKVIFQKAGILNSAYCRVDARPQPDWVMDLVWDHLLHADLAISRYLRKR